MAQPNRSRTAKVLAVAFTYLALSQPSYAYLDPGTGSIILQSILAGVAVALGLLRFYWYRFKAFVAKMTGSSRESQQKSEQERGTDSDVRNEL